MQDWKSLAAALEGFEKVAHTQGGFLRNQFLLVDWSQQLLASSLDSSNSPSRLVEVGVAEHIILSLDPMNKAIVTVVNFMFPLFLSFLFFFFVTEDKRCVLTCVVLQSLKNSLLLSLTL